MGTKSTIAVISTSLFAHIAVAEVPYQFANGQVADANQVNANFTALTDSVNELSATTATTLDSLQSELSQQSSTVESIESRVETLESGASPGSSPNYLSNVSYQFLAADVGQVLEVQDSKGNSGQYVIAKFPFAEFSSYETYSITIPIRVQESNDNGQVLHIPSLNSTNLFGQSRSCGGRQLTISGFPGCLTVTESRSIGGYDWRGYENQTDTLRVWQGVTFNLQITVGETSVGWGATFSDQEFAVQSEGGSDFGYPVDPQFNNENFNWDFTQAFDPALMDREPVEEWLTQIDQLVDYIIIERMPVASET